MRFRHLSQYEKRKSLPLYEEAFPEDRGAYAGYYYEWKCRDNEILVLVDTDTDLRFKDGKDDQKSFQSDPDSHENICAMLHLNPYRMWISTKESVLHYIVAVATAYPYRRQGCMRRLMLEAFLWLYDKMEPFTYLMPADTAYYEPFGFRVIYDQTPVSFPPDIDEANRWAKDQFDVVTLRDNEYLHFLESEPKSLTDTSAGSECSSAETVKEITELTEKNETEKELWKPQIMCRIIHLVRFLECIRSECSKKVYLYVHDPLISENEGWYCWQVEQQKSQVARLGTFALDDVFEKHEIEILQQDDTYLRDGLEYSSLTIGIENLAEQLFGVAPLHSALSHVKVLNRICINEEV